MKEEKLQEAKRLYESANADQRYVLESLFPELKEPDDMEIRKALLNYMTKMWENSLDDVCGIHVGDVIAWLEKQGETYTKRDVDDAWLKGMCDAKRELEKQSEQNSSWSKEDDVRLQACIDALQAESLMGKVDTVMTKWLESLKQRIEDKL